MAITPTTAGYTNTGHDIHLTLVKSNGGIVTFENIMQFDAKQETQDITRVRLDNRVLVADLPKLWTGTITYDRATADTDGAIAEIEQNWFAGLDYALGTMTISVASALENSTITFLDVSLKQDDSGTWRGDDATTCRLSFRAARRVVNGVGAGTNVLNQG
jgi:hypothetical protein